MAVAAALVWTATLGQPNLAYAGSHIGGGGFHGGEFGGFHDRSAGAHRDLAGRHDHFIGGLGFGLHGYPYGWAYFPDHGYYGYSQPSSSQNLYYCSDPAGFYPYVTQCNNGWETVPAS